MFDSYSYSKPGFAQRTASRMPGAGATGLSALRQNPEYRASLSGQFARHHLARSSRRPWGLSDAIDTLTRQGVIVTALAPGTRVAPPSHGLPRPKGTGRFQEATR